MSDTIVGCPFHSDKKITEFDMLDPQARENPLPYYDWLRQDEERRIYKLPQEKSFYVVHRHADVKRVLTNNKDFINHILPTKKSPFFALMDGENHLRVRSVVSKILSIRNPDFPLAAVNKNIAQYTEQMIQKKNVEIFKEWANPIPLSTLCEIFGIEPSSQFIADLHEKAITINRALFALGGTGPRISSTPTVANKYHISMAILKNTGPLFQLYKMVGSSGMAELKHMFVPQKTNKEVPRPDFEQLPHALAPLVELMLLFGDLLTRKTGTDSTAITILKETISKKEMTLAESIMACTFIMFAGYETTTSLLSNCVAHLAQNPETQQYLKENPSSIDAFIEEALRIYTPVGRFIRRANKDMEMSGVTIPKNALVIVLLGAANTDPEIFSEPFTFDTTRSNHTQTVSFGKGIHFCLGAPLARHQIKEALNLLIQNTKGIEIDPDYSAEMVTDRDNGILRYEEFWIRCN